MTDDFLQPQSQEEFVALNGEHSVAIRSLCVHAAVLNGQADDAQSYQCPAKESARTTDPHLTN